MTDKDAALEWARKVIKSKPPRYTDASRNAAAVILADANIIKAAEELAYRAEAVFKSEYHNTKHIEGAMAYYEANFATLEAYRAAVSERDT